MVFADERTGNAIAFEALRTSPLPPPLAHTAPRSDMFRGWGRVTATFGSSPISPHNFPETGARSGWRGPGAWAGGTIVDIGIQCSGGI